MLFIRLFGGTKTIRQYPHFGYELRLNSDVAFVHITNQQLYYLYTNKLSKELLR